MEIRFQKEEFDQIRRFVGNTKHSDIINTFNRIINNSEDGIPVKSTRVPITSEVLLEMSPEDACTLLKIFNRNAPAFGLMLRKDLTLSSISKWTSFISGIGDEISNAFNRKQ